MTRRWFLSLLLVCAVVRPAPEITTWRGLEILREHAERRPVYTIKTPTGCHILRERVVISVEV